MTKKHFKALANWVRIHKDTLNEDSVEQLMATLAAFNGRFDRNEFCGHAGFPYRVNGMMADYWNGMKVYYRNPKSKVLIYEK